MEVKTLLPHLLLQPYIHHYVWIDTGKLQEEEIIEQLPTHINGLVFTFPYRKRVIAETPGGVVTLPFAQIYPPSSVYSRLRHWGAKAIRIIFRPGQFHAFFKIPLDEFTNQAIDAEASIGKEMRALYDRVGENLTAMGTKHTLDDFFVQKMRRTELQPSVMPNILALLRDNPTYQVSDLSSSLGKTPRTVHRYFQAETGMSPKEWLSIRRFLKALELMQTGQFSMTDIAYRVDYSDQPHFNRHFKRMAHTAPKSFWAGLNDISRFFAHNDVDMATYFES